jgi:hypothetical protein
MPNSLSGTQGYFSNTTPRFCSHATTSSILETSHPRTVKGGGVNHAFAGAQDQSETVVLQKLKSQPALVKFPCFGGIFGRDEPD